MKKSKKINLKPYKYVEEAQNVIVDPVFGESLINGLEVLNTSKYSHDQLLAALYWIHDAMDRGLINFCVIKETADSIINNKDLYGDKISIAVRKNEWDGGGRRIVDAFAPPYIEGETEHGLVFEYDHYGTPIILHVLNDSVTLSSPNNVIYHAEYFKYPNTYDQFLEEFPWLK